MLLCLPMGEGVGVPYKVPTGVPYAVLTGGLGTPYSPEGDRYCSIQSWMGRVPCCTHCPDLGPDLGWDTPSHQELGWDTPPHPELGWDTPPHPDLERGSPCPDL